MKAIFGWPKANGDTPVTCVRTAPTMQEAMILALRDHGYDLANCTVFDEDYCPLGVIKITWPGPLVHLGDIRYRVQLSPVRSWKENAWKHARYIQTEKGA